MGSVYLAIDPKIGREVAVKVLQKEHALNKKHRQRFDREAKAIAALRHPNIVEIFDYGGSVDDHLFLVMEYVQGSDTGRFCREHGVFPESVLAAVGMELSSALTYAHGAGVIHRDLKPENVFMDRGRLVLADFGIVKAIAEENPLGAEAASPMTDVIGTPGFMAPEQLDQTPLDARTDIFALGALLYYLGCKNLPYDADSPHGLIQLFRETRPVPLSDRRPEISERMSRLVQDCLEVEPGARPQTMDDVHQRLIGVLEGLGASMPRELLKAFEKDALRFRADDRKRLIRHLVERLKVAVRDDDGNAANEIRARLAVLDPENSAIGSVSGVTQVLRGHRSITEPEVVLERLSRRRWIAASIITAVGMIGATIYITSKSRARSNDDGDQLKSRPAILRVRGTERTHVFFNGRALGTTPNFSPAMVPNGRIVLEFHNDKRGKLRHTMEVAPGESVTLVVDWRQKRVRVPRSKK